MPRLTTTFAAPLDEETLNGLTLWLDQTMFEGYEGVDYRFECTAAQINTRIPGSMSQSRQERLCAAIDDALNRIVRHLGPATSVTDSSGD
jgi:hypothetical protein